MCVTMRNPIDHKFVPSHSLIQPFGDAGDGGGGEAGAGGDFGIGNASGEKAGGKPAVAELYELVFGQQITEKTPRFVYGF